MITGYVKLNKNISNTINLIDDVTEASKEQKTGIEQINDTVTQLDQATQKNTQSASHINEMTLEIKVLANKLLVRSSQATYNKSAEKQAFNMEVTMYLNKLKFDHINFKNRNSQKLGGKTSWTVVNETQCNLGKWIIELESKSESYTKTSSWTNLKDGHLRIHKGMQDIINENAGESLNRELEKDSQELDRAISDVFKTIQQVKTDSSNATYIV